MVLSPAATIARSPLEVLSRPYLPKQYFSLQILAQMLHQTSHRNNHTSLLQLLARRLNRVELIRFYHPTSKDSLSPLLYCEGICIHDTVLTNIFISIIRGGKWIQAHSNRSAMIKN